MKRRSSVVTLSALLIYMFVSLSHLSVFPPVGEDEPWIAAASYKLATHGVYGSDLFAGYYGMDRHVYEHMPVYSLLQAATFKLFGVGVFQMRLLSVAFGLALALTVWAVGRQVAGERAGALAVVLMVGLRVADGGDATGILLLTARGSAVTTSPCQSSASWRSSPSIAPNGCAREFGTRPRARSRVFRA